MFTSLDFMSTQPGIVADVFRIQNVATRFRKVIYIILSVPLYSTLGSLAFTVVEAVPQLPGVEKCASPR